MLPNDSLVGNNKKELVEDLNKLLLLILPTIFTPLFLPSLISLSKLYLFCGLLVDSFHLLYSNCSDNGYDVV